MIGANSAEQAGETIQSVSVARGRVFVGGNWNSRLPMLLTIDSALAGALDAATGKRRWTAHDPFDPTGTMIGGVVAARADGKFAFVASCTAGAHGGAWAVEQHWSNPGDAGL